MAKGLNQVNLIGNLGGDPEVKQLPSGVSVANFNLAVNERVKKGDEWTDHVEWIRCVTFGKTAEICSEYLKKGNPVYVSGKMRTRKWEDKEGQTRYTTEVTVSDLVLLGGGSGTSSKPPAPPQSADEIPF
jgi:single-strand DNA-binding protein